MKSHNVGKLVHRKLAPDQRVAKIPGEDCATKSFCQPKYADQECKLKPWLECGFVFKPPPGHQRAGNVIHGRSTKSKQSQKRDGIWQVPMFMGHHDDPKKTDKA